MEIIAVILGMVLVLNIVLIIAVFVAYGRFQATEAANNQVITDICKIEDTMTEIKELIEGSDLPNAN